MSISAAQVKDLRDRTGAGMMDCKKALAETGGDMEAAVDILKKKGLATAEKRKGRAIKEGLIRIHVDGKTAGMVEVNCETDFVARNEEFEALATGLAKAVAAAKPASIDAVRALSLDGTAAHERLTGLIGKIGENMAITRHAVVELDGPGLIETYLHAGGKVGVIIALGTPVADRPEAREIAHELALHVAFANPMGLDRSSVPAEVIGRERRISRERALEQGKPESIVDKIVDGQINKFYGEIVLLEQPFVKDDKSTVKKWLEAQGKAIGGTPEIRAFARFALGEATDEAADES